MLFNSIAFLTLVLITFVIYYTPKFIKLQVELLVLSSLVFYGWHTPYLLLLLITSSFINIVISYAVAHKDCNKKLITILGVVINLGVLAFFKYSGLLANTLFNGNSISDFLISIPLPVGISFFTFQGISLLIDVFKENHFNNDKIIPKSFLEHSKNTFFFIAFFPQLVAGPIVKAHDFLPQIKHKTLSDINWEKVIRNVILGYFLKMVVADNLKDYTFWISFPYFQSKDSITLITMLYGFSCQIFADFSGYSLIAIGIAGLFGYSLSDNFNFPYISSSFKDFWKRWHISLSSFLMEYLYIPLGGNRKGKVRTYINLIITMILGGLWHGAAWSFAIWGAFHGIALALERLIVFNVKKIDFPGFTLIKTFFVFNMVTLAWLLFKLPEFTHVIKYFASIRKNITVNFDIEIVIPIIIYSSPVIIYHLFYLIKEKLNSNVLHKFDYVFYAILLFLIFTNSGIPGDFIYFQF